MKYTFSLLSIIASCLGSICQNVEFPTPGLTIVDIYYCNVIDCPNGEYYNNSFGYDQDTVICGNNFHRFRYVHFGYPLHFRVENGKYWELDVQDPCGPGTLLYDFGLEVGDTFVLPGFNQLYWQPDTLTVIEVNEITLNNGEDRKRILLESNLPFSDLHEWVEGIGDIRNGFFRQLDEEGGHEELVCVKDVSGLVFHNPDFPLDCDSLLCKRPHAGFAYECNGPEISFENLSINSDNYLWEFGDGSVSAEENPAHSYSAPGCYKVQLTATTDCLPTQSIGFLYINVGEGDHWESVFEPTFSFYGSFFLNKNTGWLYYLDSIHLTTDGGQNWEAVIVPESATGEKRIISEVYFYDETHGLAAAEDAIIFWTNDGGLTWQEAAPFGPSSEIRAITMTSQSVGYATPIYYPDLWKTSDGGATWEEINVFNINSIRKFFPIGEDTLYSIGSKFLGPVYPPYFFNRTFDGENFEKVEITIDDIPEISPDSPPTDIFFTDAMNGWVTTFQGLILHTSDGGNNWELQFQADTRLADIAFVSPTHGMAVGGNGIIYETFDGGANWEVAYCNWKLGNQYFNFYWPEEDTPLVLGLGDGEINLLTLADSPVYDNCLITSLSDAPLIGSPSIILYPNPTAGTATVVFNLERAAEASITASDIWGKKVYELLPPTLLPIGDFTENLNMDSWPPGVYFFKITIGEKVFSKKIIKE